MPIIFAESLEKCPNMEFRNSAFLTDEYTALAIMQGRGVVELCCLRCYVSGRGNVNYAALWVYGDAPCGCVGVSKAIGYGQHRLEAAIDAAICGAGINGAPSTQYSTITQIVQQIAVAAAEIRCIEPMLIHIHHARA